MIVTPFPYGDSLRGRMQNSTLWIVLAHKETN